MLITITWTITPHFMSNVFIPIIATVPGCIFSAMRLIRPDFQVFFKTRPQHSAKFFLPRIAGFLLSGRFPGAL